MVQFTTNTVVKQYLDTAAIDADIDAIIIDVDKAIEKETGTAPGIPTEPDTTLYETWSTLETCKRLKLRYPTAVGLGPYRETHDPVREWDAIILKTKLLLLGKKLVVSKLDYGSTDEQDT